MRRFNCITFIDLSAFSPATGNPSAKPLVLPPSSL
jgi:hypothetical protein